MTRERPITRAGGISPGRGRADETGALPSFWPAEGVPEGSRGDSGRRAAATRSPKWPVPVPGGQDGPRVPPFIARGRGRNDRWPFRDFLELGALAGAVPCARLHARQVLREWGHASLCESAELLVSELVTNAVKASRAMPGVFPVRLWLASDRERILILVWDVSPQPPARMETSRDADHGRGLVLVEAVSETWGWCPSEDRIGKFVWAVLEAL